MALPVEIQQQIYCKCGNEVNVEWRFIYLFIHSNGRYVDSIFHPFHLFPPSIFGFQLLKRIQCVSTNGTGPSPLVDHRVCSKDVKIIICDIDVLLGNHVQKVGKRLLLPHALTSHVCLQFSLSNVFTMFFWKSLGAHHPENPIGCGFDDIFPCLWLVGCDIQLPSCGAPWATSCA